MTAASAPASRYSLEQGETGMIAESTIDLKVVKEALISNLQDIRPGEENEREADRQALMAAPAATEDDVLRAYQAEIESGRDDRL